MSETEIQQAAVHIERLRALALSDDGPTRLEELRAELSRVRAVIRLIAAHVRSLHRQKVILEQMVAQCKQEMKSADAVLAEMNGGE